MAWKELKVDFEKLKSEVVNAKADSSRLAKAGLTGQQLEFKIDVLDYFIKNKLKEKALDAIDIILNSLSVVFPKTVEGLKEFKAFLKLSGKDFEEHSI